MKILTPQEEKEHYKYVSAISDSSARVSRTNMCYSAVLKGGLLGGLTGLTAGGAAVWGATQRFPAFRSLTVPFRFFLVISVGTFASVIQGDRASTAYEIARNPERQQLRKRTEAMHQQHEFGKSSLERAKDWATENRYSIVFGSWLASMGIAGAIVSRNRYLTGSQKLVQARVYAQGLTIAVLLASFALETSDMNAGRGRWETVKVVDPDDPEHKRLIEKRIHHESYQGQDQWKDMIEAEERKMKDREEAKRVRDEAMGVSPSAAKKAQKEGKVDA